MLGKTHKLVNLHLRPNKEEALEDIVIDSFNQPIKFSGNASIQLNNEMEKKNVTIYLLLKRHVKLLLRVRKKILVLLILVVI